MIDPMQAFESVRDQFFLYYDTPFGIADQHVQTDRRAELDRRGISWQLPWFEPIPDWRASKNRVEDVIAELGLSPELHDLLRCGMAPYDTLYEHQEDSLRAYWEGRDVLVTSGTGSGKTEAMFVPLLSYLVEESKRWAGTGPDLSGKWWQGNKHYEPMRSGEHRSPGIRALVLYPMNALVEDQLVRLRRALDSREARDWWDHHRKGHRAFFGRYTGPTPVPGHPPRKGAMQSGRRKELAAYLRSIEGRRKRAQQLRAEDPRVHGDTPFFVPSVDGAEMRSRWDMVHTPPDVLITNYSMLNVMMMRSLEHGMFEATRQWLDEDPSNTFHLLVDELHMYRGTSGTEVAYLMRRLLDRLGLYDRPSQLRVMAASASLGDAESFLTQFFGIDGKNFRAFTGSKEFRASRDGDLGHLAPLLAERVATDDVVQPPVPVVDRLMGAFLNEDGTDVQAKGFEQLGRELFPASEDPEQSAATRVLLRDVASTGSLRMREHLFFRNVSGVWACSDRGCSEAPRRDDGSTPTVGKVYARPRYRCECGARVLQLWYCQTCGDLLLGGYRTQPNPMYEEYMLLPEASNLEDIPELTHRTPTAANYLLFWPRGERQDVASTPAWSRSSSRGGGEQKVRNAFRRATFDPRTGRIEVDDIGGKDVWAFVLDVEKGDAELLENIPPAPTRCPSCADEPRRPPHAPLGSRAAWRSTIRGMRTGLAMMSQVLTDAALDFWAGASGGGRSEKAIAFSDSRQDAARLAGGIELYHYRQLVRQLTLQAVQDSTAAADELAGAAEALRAGDKESPAYSDFVGKHQRGGPMAKIAAGFLDPEDNPDAARDLEQLRDGAITFNRLCTDIQRRFLDLGVNPAGPDQSVSGYTTANDTRRPWHRVFDFGTYRQAEDLEVAASTLFGKITTKLRSEVAASIFSGQARDLESIGLATVGVSSERVLDPDEAVVEVATGTAIRMGLRTGIDVLRRAPLHDVPKWVEEYVAKEAEQRGWDPEVLINRVFEYLGTTDNKAVRAEALTLEPPPATSRTCTNCRRQSLARTGDTCPSCLGDLGPEQPLVQGSERDFFAETAMREPVRLHAEELTGQTGREEAQQRQAWFQQIFLDGENANVDEVDLLSVTTTMEAGVDIGALKTVLMANMPPMRFNYQQRVGRSGRRDSPLSIALTFCRENSHDETFFNEPGRITTGMPPTPFLDLTRREIVRRVLVAELLRRAFLDLSQDVEGLADLSSTHGEFGDVGDWQEHKDAIARYIAGASDEAGSVLDVLCRGGGLPNDERSTLVDEVLGSILGEIDEAVVSESPTDHLSQRLAERGVLPMFGFPTRSRTLFTERPAPRPWPPNSAISRDLKIAISDFGPGAEVVKDKAVYTAIGIAGYRPAGHTVQPMEEPLDVAVRIGSCRSCLHASKEGSRHTSCPECGSDDWLETPMVEPVGFVTDWSARDYDGSEERGRGTGAPRFLPSEDPEIDRVVGTSQIRAGAGDVLVYSDNRGAMYRLERRDGKDPLVRHHWLSRSVLDRLREEGEGAVSPTWLDAGSEREVVLGLTIHTDTLTIRVPEAPPGCDLSIAKGLSGGANSSGAAIGRKAAWYSLGTLLVKAAANLLQVDTVEFLSGVSSYTDADGMPATQLVIADSLENGAGFSTHLAEVAVFEELLRNAANLIEEDFESEGHIWDCDSSCYDCLREFGNTGLHPLLDWRLARTMLKVLRGDDVSSDIDDARRGIERPLEELAKEVGNEAEAGYVSTTGVPYLASQGRVLLVTHPIEAALTDSLSLAEAVEASRAIGDPILDHVATTIDVVRRPGDVMAMLPL